MVKLDDTLVSYNEKEIIHSELSEITKKNITGMLYQFINDGDKVETKSNIESTFGVSIKPLGYRR